MKEPKKKKSNAGRKKFVIDWDKVDNSLRAGSNGVQVAAMLGVHPETLYDRCQEDKKTNFSEYLQQKRQEGNDVLFGLQYKLAKEGDRGMLIWLGKNYLGQREPKSQVEHTGGLTVQKVTFGKDDKPN